MADIRPFRAYRPAKGLEQTIAALPYDVYTREEAKAYVAEHPDSFLAIDRAESQFPDDVSTYDDRVYQKAKQMLDAKFADGSFVQDPTADYYVYEEVWHGRSQTGVAACAAIDDYLSGVIRKHENTVEAKEEDRIRHVDTCGAQTGPIFLAYRRNETIERIVQEVKEKDPVYDFESAGDIRNRVWVVDDPEKIAALREAFSKVPRIYIADGHHRAASAVKVGLKRRKENPGYTGEEPFNFFLCVLFPENELEIIDYNRVVRDLNGYDKSEILTRMKRLFNVTPYRKNQAKPQAKGEIGMYIGHSWYMLSVKNVEKSRDPVENLDVTILQKKVLEPIFGIKDPRTDDRIAFVGGNEGLAELERRADATKGAAFALYPTSIRELFAVADENRLMPPKSTLFEPKLLSGLFIHRI